MTDAAVRQTCEKDEYVGHGSVEEDGCWVSNEVRLALRLAPGLLTAMPLSTLQLAAGVACCE